jgi:hypothetical protein
VLDGTTVGIFVEVIFNRDAKPIQADSAVGPLSITADIWDHDEGLFPIPGVDDLIVGPVAGALLPAIGMGGKAVETQVIGPFIFTLDRADAPGIRQVFSTPPGAIVESGLALTDFEFEDQDLAQTLEIFSPNVTVKDTSSGREVSKASASFKLSVLLPGEIPPPGSVQIPIPEPCTLLLLGSGLAGVIGFGRKRLFKKA